MTLTKRLQGAGAWDLTLRSQDTPWSVLSALNPDTSLYGSVVITDAPLDDITSMSDADALELSVFTGRLLEQDGFQFFGDHVNAWVGTSGRGPQKTVDLPWGGTGAESFSEWHTEFVRNGLSAGFVGSIGGTYAKTYPRTHMLEALNDVCLYFGAEWDVTNDGLFRMGTAAQLFNMTPSTVIVNREAFSGRDLNVTGISGNLRVNRSGADWARTLRYWSGDPDSPTLTTESGGVDAADVPYRAMDGTAAEIMMRIEDYSDDPGGTAATLAAAQYGRFNTVRQEIALSTLVYDVGADVQVGDMVWVWDPILGLTDPAGDPVDYRGETLYPVPIRCVGWTRPIVQGMGVYFRCWREGVSGWEVTWTDLTPHIEWESGETRIEVGAKPRKLTDF